MANASHTGLSVDAASVAFAHIERDQDGNLCLNAAAIDKETASEDWAQQLALQLDSGNPTRGPVTSLLPTGSYQLLLTEVPNVPADELNAAVRWQVRELLDFPADETVIELFEMPDQSSATDKPMAYAVATRRSNIQEHIKMLQTAGFSPEAIDIPELCARNIATQLPQDADGVAFLHLTDSHGILTITRQGVLYLVRLIDTGRSAIKAAAADSLAHSELVAGIVLEIQRSLDYYESHFERRQMTELVLAPGSDIGGLAASLHEQLGLSVSSLDLKLLFNMTTAVSPEEQGVYLLAVGGALRAESLVAQG